MTKDDVLSPKQRSALPTFCTQLNIEKACAEVGISKQTFYQWIKNPHFKRELWRMRRAIGTQSIEQLKIEEKPAKFVSISIKIHSAGVRRAFSRIKYIKH